MTEKEVCMAIIENAKCKPVFVDFTGGILDQMIRWSGLMILSAR